MSSPPSPRPAPVATNEMLIGALLRVPAQAIHRRIIRELNAAGFEELRVPHMAVLQFPSPDGVRPGLLAERAGMSKQAMNQLLRSLEGLGYLARSDSPDEGRARIVRLTKRGRAAYAKIHEILRPGGVSTVRTLPAAASLHDGRPNREHPPAVAILGTSVCRHAGPGRSMPSSRRLACPGRS